MGATEKFQNDQEKLDTFAKFPNIRNPAVNPNQPALKIMMKTNRGRGPGLFMHDVLYNINIEEREGTLLVMNCMTGDMQMAESGRVSWMQAKGTTAITLFKESGIAFMDIGGGFGKEKWVMNPKNQCVLFLLGLYEAIRMKTCNSITASIARPNTSHAGLNLMNGMLIVPSFVQFRGCHLMFTFLHYSYMDSVFEVLEILG